MEKQLSAMTFALLAGSAMFAQTVFDKPPAGVEEALRARIAKFYQAHVDGKYRLADAVVAEDSKDDFFAANKTRYYGFEISQITYTDNYTKARVVVLVDMNVRMVFAAGARMKAPITSLWKLEDGEWYWYALHRKPGEDVVTPFGRISGAQIDQQQQKAAGGALPPIKGPDINSLRSMVKANKKLVLLNAKEPSSDFVEITNSMPGVVKLQMRTASPPGLTIKCEPAELGPNQTGRVVFSYQPGDRSTRTALVTQVLVIPSDVVIPIQVSFVDRQ